MKPYEQGALDGLCAVYSIVNATRIVSGIGDEEAKALFKEIIRYLETRKDLGKIKPQYHIDYSTSQSPVSSL